MSDRSTHDSTTTACQYDAQDRAIAGGIESYSCNKSGQLTAITDTTSNTTTAFQYDMLGNLRQVTMPDGRRIDYLVDGLDRRIGKSGSIDCIDCIVAAQFGSRVSPSTPSR